MSVDTWVPSDYSASKFMEALPPYIDVRLAAEIRRCHVSHIYSLLGRKRFKAVKDGTKLLIVTESFLEDMARLPEAKLAWPTNRKREAAGTPAVHDTPKPTSRRGRPRKHPAASMPANAAETAA
jgi:hypothetical protein